MSQNGEMPEAAEVQDAIQERKENRRKRAKREQAALQQAFNADGDLSRSFVETIVSKNDLDIGAPEGAEGDVVAEATVAKLQNMLSRDWVLGNLTEAQEHDARNKAEVLKLKIEDMHPPSESHLQGAVRGYYHEDSSEALRSLTAQERLLVDELIETLKVRFGRGRGGFERKQENTSISRAETDDDDSDDSGSSWGLF